MLVNVQLLEGIVQVDIPEDGYVLHVRRQIAEEAKTEPCFVSLSNSNQPLDDTMILSENELIYGFINDKPLFRITLHDNIGDLETLYQEKRLLKDNQTPPKVYQIDVNPEDLEEKEVIRYHNGRIIEQYIEKTNVRYYIDKIIEQHHLNITYGCTFQRDWQDKNYTLVKATYIPHRNDFDVVGIYGEFIDLNTLNTISVHLIKTVRYIKQLKMLSHNKEVAEKGKKAALLRKMKNIPYGMEDEVLQFLFKPKKTKKSVKKSVKKNRKSSSKSKRSKRKSIRKSKRKSIRK